jgi:cytochrome c-type biogenesis protein CcmH
MVFWILVSLVMGAAVALLTGSGVNRRGTRTLAADAAALPIYRDQLAELERDVASGLVPAAEAKIIRAEIARRIVREPAPDTGALQAEKRTWLHVLVPAIIVPVIAVSAYLVSGNPQMTDLPLSARLEAAQRNDDMPAMVKLVEMRLQTNPDDVRAWTVIAPIYEQLNRFGDAAFAYQNLIRLGQATPDVLTSFAEAQVFENGGIANEPAMRAVAEALKVDPSHFKARFYDAMGTRQLGRSAEALAKYQALLADAPADARWKPIVETEIAALSSAPALTTEQMAAGEKMKAGDQQEMILGMVNGLEEKLKSKSDDVEGWLRLIRARHVLGDVVKVKSSLRDARLAVAAQPEALAALDALARELNIP